MATTIAQAQLALATRVKNIVETWTGFPLEVEMPNGVEVNRSIQSHPFLKVQLMLQDGNQIDLSNQPGNRILGTIVVEVFSKEGSGTIDGNTLLEFAYRRLHMTDTMPPLRTLASRFATRQPRDGWVAQAAIIPFWFDSMP